MIHRSFSVLALIATVSLASACKEDDETAATDAPAETAESSIDACSLVTAQDLTRITSLAFEEGKDPTGDKQQCGFGRIGSSEGGVNITVHPGRGEAAYDNMSALPGAEKTTGIGDKGLWNETLGSYFVVKGKNGVNVGFNFPNPKKEWGEQIATLIAAKL